MFRKLHWRAFADIFTQTDHNFIEKILKWCKMVFIISHYLLVHPRNFIYLNCSFASDNSSETFFADDLLKNERTIIGYNKNVWGLN